MESVILVIHLIVALGIIGLVLLQPSESGGFLGNSGTMSNLMAPRRSGDPLTRLTAIFVAIFFATSLGLAILAEHRAPQQGLLDAPAVEETAPAPSDAGLKAAPAAAAPAAAADKKKPAPAKKAEPVKPKKPTAPISQ